MKKTLSRSPGAVSTRRHRARTSYVARTARAPRPLENPPRLFMCCSAYSGWRNRSRWDRQSGQSLFFHVSHVRAGRVKGKTVSRSLVASVTWLTAAGEQHYMMNLLLWQRCVLDRCGSRMSTGHALFKSEVHSTWPCEQAWAETFNNINNNNKY